MRLFNTLTRRIEPLMLHDRRASMYVCGVTPYDTTHLGHAFTYVSYDVLARFLRHQGVHLTYAQNVTDVDDDILRKAAEVGLAYDALAHQETRRFREDMASLNVTPPDHFIAATEKIPDIVGAIGVLFDRGYAYVSEGNVYFDSGAYPHYGDLSHGTRQEMIALAAQHGGFPDDPAKRDPLDFLLWQKHRRGEPEWPSPFGAGRPGWHIECSTIATTVLGLPVSIHGGGADLIFPHHASEIAQAESATEVSPFVRHWMHTAMVRMEGEKMSKSLGNMVFIRDLLQRYSSDAIRLYLLSHHYREEFEWSPEKLDKASGLAAQLSDLAAARPNQKIETGSDPVSPLDDFLADDLQTPRAVQHLAQMTSAASSGEEINAAVSWARDVLGLTLVETTLRRDPVTAL